MLFKFNFDNKKSGRKKKDKIYFFILMYNVRFRE